MYVRMDRYDVSIVPMPPACLFWPCLVNLVFVVSKIMSKHLRYGCLLRD